MKRAFRTRSIALLLGLTLALLSVSVAFAAPPQPVHIEVDEVIGGSGDPFTAFGAAVGAGKVCSYGVVNELGFTTFGPPPGTYTYMNVGKKFICGDGSGTFDIQMKVKLNNVTGYTTAKWKITDGTGDYVTLKGHGTLVGDPNQGVNDLLDIYDGKVH